MADISSENVIGADNQQETEERTARLGSDRLHGHAPPVKPDPTRFTWISTINIAAFFSKARVFSHISERLRGRLEANGRNISVLL